MTIDQLRAAHQSRPFRPFTLYMADGRKVVIPHHEFLAHSQSGRTIIVHHLDDQSVSIIDLLLVTELNIHAHRSVGDTDATDDSCSI
jgi:hypothetical protein